jgi:hypothetical protein
MDERTIDACAVAGVKIIRICLGIDPVKGYRECIDAFRRRCEALAPALERSSVTIGMQNHHGNDIGSAMGLMDAIAIFTLNMTYDVPVKLLSFHLVLMSLFLVAPNMRRLFDLFVLHRSSTLREEPSFGRGPLVRRNAAIAQVAFGVVVFLLNGYGTMRVWNMYGGGAPKSPLFGIWDVQQMTVDGEVRPPLLTDSTRWRRLIFQSPTGARFQRPNDSIKSYLAAIDTNARTLTLTTADAAKTRLALSYQRPSHERLLIDGTMDGHAIHDDASYVPPELLAKTRRSKARPAASICSFNSTIARA